MSSEHDTSPVLVWFRRDLRLADHPALRAACETGRPVIPVFILDQQAEALGAAPKWRLGQGIDALARALAARGSRLILRRGPARAALEQLVAETGARAVYWSRAYDPEAIARDRAVKQALRGHGLQAHSFPGHLLFEPWTVKTGQGTPYKVFTPMWRALAGRDPGAPMAPPARLTAPADWPASDRLEDWRLGRAMHRGAEIVARHVAPGESAAQDRLAEFIETRVAGYDRARDFPARAGTSGLSDYLALGEISPRQCWAAAIRVEEEGATGAASFRRELVWREFAYHLMFHTPHILQQNWRPEWRGFPWRSDPDAPELRAWKRGRTGVAMVDAAMRELHVTGRMHNRGRMIVASYLTKNLLTDWRIGQDWFAQHLVDWDPACNALGWQWVAGCGPDAAPYFRIFNPDAQAGKFDPDGAYRRRWLAEGQAEPGADALAFFAAIPRRWGLSPDDPWPDPVCPPKRGRDRALAAYQTWRETKSD